MAYLRALFLLALTSLAFTSLAWTAASAASPRDAAAQVPYVQLVTQQLKGCYKTCRKSTDPNCVALCKTGGTLQESGKKYRATTCAKQCGAHDVDCTQACIRKLKRDDF